MDRATGRRGYGTAVAGEIKRRCRVPRRAQGMQCKLADTGFNVAAAGGEALPSFDSTDRTCGDAER